MNKFETIVLETIQYPGFDFYNYYTIAERINHTYSIGKIPMIRLCENQNKRPLIAVLLGRDKHPDRAEADYGLTRWVVESMLNYDLYPVFISYEKTAEQLRRWKPVGIVLPGGSYHFPAQLLAYQNPNWSGAPDFTRFDANKLALQYAVLHRLPTLGLCAGMQVIAGHLGAKMAHIKCAAPETTIAHYSHNTMHTVDIEKDSDLFKITGAKKYDSNSFHNSMLCPDFCAGLKISAKSSDGIIEAIEPKEKDKWNKFVIGTQWHAEKMAVLGDKNNPDAKIFQAFAESVSMRKR
ncbi:MAG: gamma-glutamyl-gamma-aminobutyrate hydrolase family protein [Alphaproteobacteria bacterium]|nr:gamma-glutamyl-gamma-aminobutyrate hydrolase family protein [Alphaproteobacteria bacterium]